MTNGNRAARRMTGVRRGVDSSGAEDMPRPERPRPVAPVTIYYGCPLENYVTRGLATSLQTAAHLDDVLRAYADDRAERDGIAPGVAFVRVIETIGTVPGLENGPAIYYILAEMSVRKHRFGDPESMVMFVTGLRAALEDTWAKETPEMAFHHFWRRFWCALELLLKHQGCDTIPRSTDVPIDVGMLLRALAVWSEINFLVPVCKYLRLEQALDRRVLKPETAYAVLRRHGANVLDDLIEMIEAEAIDEAGLAAMAALAELPHDAAAPTYPPAPALAGNKLGAAMGHVFPGWKTIDDFLLMRGGLFRESHALRPGWYRPVTASSLDPVVATGLRTRLKVDGRELDGHVERVRRIFGKRTAAEELLFALDLFAYWRGTVPHALCLRAARAKKSTRVPDNLALELFAQFGPGSIEGLVTAMERGQFGVRETIRFLRHPAILHTWKTHIGTFLSHYRAAGSPSDLARVALSIPQTHD